MKKLFVLTMFVLPGACFAQRSITPHAQPISIIDQANRFHSYSNPGMKTTAEGDTTRLANISTEDTLTVYTIGSDARYGYVLGTDTAGDQGFAERYDLNTINSQVQVLGVYALFGGTVNPASTRAITFGVWDQSAPLVITDTLVYSGFPGNILDTVSVPLTQLGIGSTYDTLKAYLFPYPTGFLYGSFFVGYGISYTFSDLNGDTIGLASSLNGSRTSPKSSLSVTISDGDTTVTTIRNVQNATQQSDYNWIDNYSQANSLSNDLAIYPIIVVGPYLNVNGVKRNNLTFFGNYPNPAVNRTNIKFSLSNKADVTIQIMDMAGRIQNSIKQPGLSIGEHIVPVNTSDMPAGDYLYLIRTSDGDGIAGKMSINP